MEKNRMDLENIDRMMDEVETINNTTTAIDERE